MVNWSQLIPYIGIFSGIFVLFLVIIIVFFIQEKNIQNGVLKPGKEREVTSSSLAMSILGMVMFFVAIAWIILSVEEATKQVNITEDATTVYISRNNIYTNFDILNHDQYGAITTDPGKYLKDGEGCYPPNNANQDIAEATNKQFFDIATSYVKGMNYQNWYRTVPSDPSTSDIPVTDNLVLQQKRSLAFYRNLNCMNTMFTNLLNKNAAFFTGWMSNDFLTNVLPHVGSSSVPGTGCLASKPDVPDTLYCRTANWFTGDGNTKCSVADTNPCFLALTQSFAAQCLLYDDQVSKKITGTTMGTLEAFELAKVYIAGF